ncbi:trehalose-phosphatase [Catellatospora chokoriensis]|uniref:Trehalose 6-phosphate phosphatase n=1 Tax=Catellatospora chokoriensis TaxID=310353 RepID=A0A8J3KBV8_9ACTN|nr:trehalose-phosphatase [Catellatospora chokoriensis]GIF94365.1 trehalose 6-phosphate phosphatase [Catellatospora chokoriensis]
MTEHPSRALAYVRDNAAAAGLVLDFDGVLSPMVDEPAESRLMAGNAELLARLRVRLRALAVVSGRPTEFLRDRVPVPGVHVVGSYGLEDDPETESWLPMVRWATTELERIFAGGEGVWVERKAVTVAAHWRTAADRAHAQARAQAAVERLAAETGLWVVPGKLVLELRPPLAVDKGTTLARLVAGHGLQAVVYVGDDEGDAPAMRQAVVAGGHALLVDHGAETPSGLRELASEVFPGVEGFQVWLGALAEQLDRP